MLLKRLSDAQKDGDKIYAVIRVGAYQMEEKRHYRTQSCWATAGAGACAQAEIDPKM